MNAVTIGERSLEAQAQKVAIVIMARFRDGQDDTERVKTRLAEAIGPESARDLYEICLSETMRSVERASVGLGGAHLWVDWDQPVPEGKAMRNGWRSLVQRGEGLGPRLAHAFAELFSLGYQRVVVVGSDTPSLPTTYLSRAVDESTGDQVVMGPCLDGGYYLIAMGSRVWGKLGQQVQAVLASVPTGSTTTCARTVRGLKQAGLDVSLLGAWVDIDEEADLPLAGRLSQGIARKLGRVSHGAQAASTKMSPDALGSALLAERGQPLTELKEIYLHLTDECKRGCLHCYNAQESSAEGRGVTISGRTRTKELSLAELCSVVDEAVSLGARSFVVIGGDPFAKDCLLPLLDYLTGERSCTARLFLSALPRHDPADTLKNLAKAGHGKVIPMVSLEGPEAVNDRIRGAGSFAESKRLIELLRDVGLEPFVNTVLLRPCLTGLPDLPATLAELGVGRLHLILPHQRGRARGAQELIPTGREVLLAFRELQESAAAHGIAVDNLDAFRGRLAGRRDFCNAGCSLLALGPYGGVYPCPITVGDPAFAAGSVRSDTLASIWRSSPLLEMVRSAHALDRGDCRDCDVAYACGGECWVQAHYAARAAGGRGGFGAPFPYCDFVRPLLRQLLDELEQSGGIEDGAPADLTPFECT